MTLLGRLIKHLHRPVSIEAIDPAKAYNLWSQQYDMQQGNLMLALDEKLFSDILCTTDLKDKIVVDIGCGTGRHWWEIISQQPRAIKGYDVSAGMLKKLKDKFPDAVICQMESNLLPQLENKSIDVIISTLTIAHIEHIEEAFEEWHRVLNNSGEIIITDYHPAAFVNGGDRTFSYQGQTIAIKNYIHPINEVCELLQNMGFDLVSFEEKRIDHSVKHYYEEKNALHVFEKFENVPIIYGMHLKKRNAFT